MWAGCCIAVLSNYLDLDGRKLSLKYPIILYSIELLFKITSVDDSKANCITIFSPDSVVHTFFISESSRENVFPPLLFFFLSIVPSSFIT